MLEISHLTKQFGATPVLREVSFTVEPGALIAILGASGGGKTTLLRLIAGFERPDAGEIRLAGETLAGPGVFVPPERRGIGYVAQEGALFPHLSVADNITFGLNRAARRARARVDELLSMVDLPSSYAGRAPQSLSGGEQQRVALARALAPNPGLVLLDEPFSALDAGLRAETRLAVARAISAAGATAILVTHDQAEALSMGSRIGVLQNGALSALRAPAALYHAPADPGLASFIGEAVFAQGMAQGGQVHCALGRLTLAEPTPDGPVQVMLRPEQIKLNGTGTPARVRAVTFYGHDAVLRLNLETGEDITARIFTQNVPAAGAQVRLGVEGSVVAYKMEGIEK